MCLPAMKQDHSSTILCIVWLKFLKVLQETSIKYVRLLYKPPCIFDTLQCNMTAILGNKMLKHNKSYGKDIITLIALFVPTLKSSRRIAMISAGVTWEAV